MSLFNGEALAVLNRPVSKDLVDSRFQGTPPLIKEWLFHSEMKARMAFHAGRRF